MRLIIVPLIAAGYAFGLVTGSVALVQESLPPPPQPTAFVWADRVFSSKRDLTKWLESRGSTYEAWAARYPAAARSVQALQLNLTSSGRTNEPRRAAVTPPAGRAGDDHAMLAIGIVLTAVVGLFFLAIVVRLTSWHRYAAVRLRRRPGRRAVRRKPRPAFADRRTERRAASQVPTTSRPAPVAVRPRRTRAIPTLAPAVQSARSLESFLQRPLQMSHHLRTRLEERNRAQRGESDAAGVGLQPMRIRETFHRKLPDFAMYATSILLACVIGASVAIYLK